MRFFIDTANVDDIKKANDMGVICGVTTNPSLIAKEGRKFEDVIAEIASIVDGPISGEVKATTTDAEGMIREGREIAKIHPNMVVKIPMTTEGLKAVKVLAAEGIKTNVTLIFTANQALLAARAGAAYVSPFLGRLDDISVRGVELVEEIAEIFAVAGIETEIIAASVRNPMHITDCALAGADIATVPYKVLEQKASLSDRAHVSEELVEKYQKYVNELIDRNKVAQASADTQETTRHNTERGRLVSLLFYLVSNGLMSIDDEIRSAALLLDIVVRPYKGIQDEAHDAETASIKGLLADLGEMDLRNAIQTLNLQDTIDKLEAANDAFEEAKARRIQVRHTRYLQVTTDELRRMTDDTLLEIEDLIRASAIIASVTAEQEDTVTYTTQLINEMNAVTRSFKTTYNQSMAQKRAHQKNPEIPSEEEVTDSEDLEEAV